MPAYTITTKNGKGDDVVRRYGCRCAQDCSKGAGWIARAPMAECFPDGACKCACHDFVSECRAATKRREGEGWTW